jgi:hypothetical protein
MMRRRLPLALWCALALLAAQALGQWHGALHALALDASHLPAASVAADADHAAHHTPGSADCRLLDQLLQAGAPPVAALLGLLDAAFGVYVSAAGPGVQPAPVWAPPARGPPGPVPLT